MLLLNIYVCMYIEWLGLIRGKGRRTHEREREMES